MPVPDLTLEKGMALVIQPNMITTDEHARVQTGQLVVVTDDGIDLCTTSLVAWSGWLEFTAGPLDSRPPCPAASKTSCRPIHGERTGDRCHGSPNLEVRRRWDLRERTTTQIRDRRDQEETLAWSASTNPSKALAPTFRSTRDINGATNLIQLGKVRSAV